jgi:hypothetical protein
MGGPTCVLSRKERRTTRELTAAGWDKEGSPPQGTSKEAGAEDAMEATTLGDYSTRVLQTNLGRSRRAQDLFFQAIRENAVTLAVVAEPYRVLDSPD